MVVNWELMKTKSANCDGFTLVEIMIVVAIIGLLAALALPSLQQARQRTQMTRIANDLRVFGAAFELYNLENRGWPPDTHNVLPAGMADYLDIEDWNRAPLANGNYNWEGPDSYSYAGISLFDTGANDDLMTILDGILDDGNLGSGLFLKTPNGRYTYILEDGI